MDLGERYTAQGRFQEALMIYDRMDNPSPTNYFHKGVIFQRLHRDDEAVECYRRVLAVYPDHVSTLWNLALLYGIDEGGGLDYGYVKPRMESTHSHWTPERESNALRYYEKAKANDHQHSIESKLINTRHWIRHIPSYITTSEFIHVGLTYEMMFHI